MEIIEYGDIFPLIGIGIMIACLIPVIVDVLRLVVQTVVHDV